MQKLTASTNYKTLRQAEIELSKRSLFEFCRTLSPEYYRDNRPHLKTLCDTLQAFYERRLFKNTGKYYTKLIIEMPPQHGKSRTLTNFCAWVLGKNQQERIITGSYNDDLAQDFSRYTRDIIQAETNSGEIVYSDIFPDVKIKYGDASYRQWSLAGQFFNYKGTGVGGSITGKGATVRIIDDPVKSAEVAYNESALDKLWLWYTGTWLSRRGGSVVMDIICNTPWAKKDITGRLLDLEPDNWYRLSMPAIDKNGDMLCSEILDKEAYEDMKIVADEHIFAANYLMERLDIKGRLYSGFKTYTQLPDNTQGVVSYTDTADEGDDYLCTIVAKIKDQYWYVVDVQYTQEAQEVTEPETANIIMLNNCTSPWVESNNGGRAFARNVQRIIKERQGRMSPVWFHQGQNKKARILTHANTVQQYVIFPEDWKNKWPNFYNALMAYQKDGKNKHDDAPDALTGLVEKTARVKLSNGITAGRLGL